MTVAEFIQDYPEFQNAETAQPAFVARALRQATAQVSQTVWGSLYQDGVFALAAHILAMSPFGEFTRLESDKTSSPYRLVYEQMRATLPTNRFGVAGFPYP